MFSPDPFAALAPAAAPFARRPAVIDLEAVRGRQRAMWSSPAAPIAALVHPVAEALVQATDIRATDRVLDVASGTGNAALAVARTGASVIAVDGSPSLLTVGRMRAAAEGLGVDFLEASAEALPFVDGLFDAAVSVFGVMAATDQQRAASELLRVVRPGGTLALAAWTPDGFMGELARTVARHQPGPSGVASPFAWGGRPGIGRLLGTDVLAVGARERAFTFRFASAEALVATFRAGYGPVQHAFAQQPYVAEQVALYAELVDLVRAFDRLGGPDGSAVAVDATYLEVIAIRG